MAGDWHRINHDHIRRQATKCMDCTAGGGLLKRMEISDEFLPIKELKDVVGDAIISINEDAESKPMVGHQPRINKGFTSGNQHRYNSFKQINGLQSNNSYQRSGFSRPTKPFIFWWEIKDLTISIQKPLKPIQHPANCHRRDTVMNQTIPSPGWWWATGVRSS